jgi:hypothetical protein
MVEGIEQFIRYAIPGYVAAFPIVMLGFVFAPNEVVTYSTIVGVLFLGFGLFLGYIVQNWWLISFEDGGAYWDENLDRNEEIIDRGKIKERMTNKHVLPVGKYANLIWLHTLFGEDMPSAIRDHDIRIWHFYHSLRSTSLSCIFGVYLFIIILLVGLIISKPLIFFGINGSFFIMYLYFYYLLDKKADKQHKIMMEFERELVRIHWDKFCKVLIKMFAQQQKDEQKSKDSTESSVE